MVRTSWRAGLALAAGAMLLFQVALPETLFAESISWTRTYAGSDIWGARGEGVAVAPTGSVYVTGVSADGLVLRKYTSGGTPVWTRTYLGTGSIYAWGYGVAVAPDGSVYVVGKDGSAIDNGLVLLKYSSSGTRQWARTVQSSAGEAFGSGVAVGPDGGIYVSGSTRVAGQDYDILVRKYTSGGGLMWSTTYNHPANGADHGEGIAVAPDGNVYVVGASDVSTTVETYNVVLLKYSAAGTKLWSRGYNGPANSNDWGMDVAVAPDGNIHVTGWSYSPGTDVDLLRMKYSVTGSRLSAETYNGTANGDDRGNGLAVNSAGSVYYVGSTEVVGELGNWMVRRYSSRLARVWKDVYNGTAGREDWASDVALSADGGVYVVGTTDAGTGHKLMLRKYK